MRDYDRDLSGVLQLESEGARPIVGAKKLRGLAIFRGVAARRLAEAVQERRPPELKKDRHIVSGCAVIRPERRIDLENRR